MFGKKNNYYRSWSYKNVLIEKSCFFLSCCKDFSEWKADWRHNIVFARGSFLKWEDVFYVYYPNTPHCCARLLNLLLTVTMAEQEPEPEVLEMVSL